MAKAKDLAGLAALGALGYYLGTRGEGDKKAAPAAPVAAAEPSDDTEDESAAETKRLAATKFVSRPTAASKTSSIGAKAAEAAASSAADARDLEAGMSRGTRSTSMAGAGRGVTVPTRPAAVATSNTEEGMRNYKPRYTPPGSLPVSTGGRRPEEDVAPLRYQSLQDRARAYEDERAKSRVGMYGTAFKKGGAVKAKTPTASKRADGIASRGKTRGKIY